MMDCGTRQKTGSPTPLQLAVGLMSAVAAVLLLTLLALNAFDVFAVLLVCGAVVLLERTVGDWLADRLGDTAGKVLLIAFVGVLVWGALGTDTGRASMLALLRAGYERGFESAIVSVELPVFIPPLPTPSASAPAASANPSAPRPPSPNPTTQGKTLPLPKHADARLGAGSAAASDSRVGGSHARPADRMTVSAIPTQRAEMVLRAHVMAGMDNVADGLVEFSLNGTVMARVPVGSDGVAEARIANLIPGSYRVTAQYVGNQVQDGRVEGGLHCIATSSRPVTCS